MALKRALWLMLLLLSVAAAATNTNNVYQPCADARIQRSDGFTFGIAFSSRDSFFYNQNQSLQLSPCDRRLSLSFSNSQLALFRPRVDEISLLTINTSSFFPVSYTVTSFIFSFSFFLWPWLIESDVVRFVFLGCGGWNLSLTWMFDSVVLESLELWGDLLTIFEKLYWFCTKEMYKRERGRKDSVLAKMVDVTCQWWM